MAKDGRLTTHVLDTARGRPAGGLRIELWAADDGRRLITSATTNADGRTDGPLLHGDDFKPGTYELVFYAGDYLRQSASRIEEPAFLDIVPIRFGISNAHQHYHVPLLLSPFGYSTYRGS
jgi:5-hydroxyisourate hydrolase